ncbi:MAG TPA: glycoside hydrolase family 2 TIM barrel-domain containing protein [Armatimonadota bacterium]|jgi:beta-galactosidase
MMMRLRYLALAALLCFAPAAFAANRASAPLNAGWRFVREDAPNAQQPAFDDSAWKPVTLPHCWNIDAGQDGDRGAYYHGAGWYRRHLTVPPAPGRRRYLRFGAAFVVTDVFVNGRKAGHHEGGYAAFCYDITRLLRPGRDNVIAVRVMGSPDEFVGPPKGGDYSKFGGLYRGVSLLETGSLCISPVADASPGVFLTTDSLTPKAAGVGVSTLVRNAGASAASLDVRCRVLNADGRLVAAARTSARVAAGAAKDVTQRVTIPDPHLWDGVRDPYLYRAVVDILSGGQVVDTVEQPLGLRSFHVDPKRGFILNGKPTSLHGVNRHQDRLNEGWAVSAADEKQDMGMIREIGATCLRTAHYQQSDAIYSECDRSGIVVWTELCMVDAVKRSAEFRDSAHRQLRELILQNYNHPSICFWSLFNEISFEGNKPPNEDDLAFLRGLNADAKRMDETRLTTGACSDMKRHRDVLPITDVTAWNPYPGWYGGKVGVFTDTLEPARAASGGHGVGVSEYGAGASIQHHQASPSWPKSDRAFHPEEWQTLVHEADWRTLKSDTAIWGTFVWNMFDFASIVRREGDHRGRNDKGLVTYDRGTRKDAFYFYQAQWTKKPMIHVAERRFNPRPAGPAVVTVFSNCPSVTLWDNGRSLGAKPGDGGVFRWTVDLPNGAAHVEAVGQSGATRVADAVDWNCSAGAPSRIGPADGLRP